MNVTEKEFKIQYDHLLDKIDGLINKFDKMDVKFDSKLSSIDMRLSGDFYSKSETDLLLTNVMQNMIEGDKDGQEAKRWLVGTIGTMLLMVIVAIVGMVIKT